MSHPMVITLMVISGLAAVALAVYFIVIPVMRVVLNFFFPCHLDLGWNPFC